MGGSRSLQRAMELERRRNHRLDPWRDGPRRVPRNHLPVQSPRGDTSFRRTVGHRRTSSLGVSPPLTYASWMSRPIDPAVDIGHIHLKVADLDRAIAFYYGVLGFEVTGRYGKQAAFLS